MSSRRTAKERRLDELLRNIRKNDNVIVAELSRLGRSIAEIVLLVQTLTRKNVTLIAIKENLTLNGKPTVQSKIFVTMFGLFAELERDLIGRRKREGLAAARARGVRLGNPRLHDDNSVRKEQASEFAELQRAMLEGFILRGMS